MYRVSVLCSASLEQVFFFFQNEATIEDFFQSAFNYLNSVILYLKKKDQYHKIGIITKAELLQ